MAKVLRIEEPIVEVGDDEGVLHEYHISDFNYTPRVGDEVTIYRGIEKTTIAYNDHRLDMNDVRDVAQHVSSNVSAESANRVVVNKIAYALFAIFLGSLGVHKFYAKKPIIGVIMILFCWTTIPGIIGFVEGIIALTKKEDSEGNIEV